MKKRLSFIFIMFVLAMPLWAVGTSNNDPLAKQSHLDIRLGTLVTFDTLAGFRGGITYGIPIDRLVTISLTGDYYRTTFNYDKLTTTNSSQTVQGQGSINSGIFLLNFRVYYPQVFFSFLVPYIQVGLGYALAFCDYTYQNSAYFGSYWYGDFAMDLNLGAKLAFGEKTDLFVQLGYTHAALRNLGPTGAASYALQTTQGINLSGLNLLTGISFHL